MSSFALFAATEHGSCCRHDLQNQSDFCLYVPVSARDNPAHRVYLQLDSTSEAVRDVWIRAINAMYRATHREAVPAELEAAAASDAEFPVPTADSKTPTSRHHTRQFHLQPVNQLMEDDNVYVWESSASGACRHCCY
eukprot:SAG22_NODE_4371_length_1289_cov_3.142857_1_plen_137_part_00